VARIKGSKKTGGRKKGTPNKQTALVEQIVADNDFNPILAMVKIAKDANTPLDLKLRASMAIAEYLYPKRRAIETTPAAVQVPPFIIKINGV
jgi:hypothetical protein